MAKLIKPAHTIGASTQIQIRQREREREKEKEREREYISVWMEEGNTKQ